jgi:hypothetical protein
LARLGDKLYAFARGMTKAIYRRVAFDRRRRDAVEFFVAAGPGALDIA